MLNTIRLTLQFIRYFFTASNGQGHGIHSPFIYDFVTAVLDQNSYNNIGFLDIEKKRKELERNQEEIEVLDLGAGSKYNQTNRRTIGSIARSAAKPKKYAQLLYRIVKHYDIEHVLELGTSLGITTRYLALAHPVNGVITIEGAPNIASFTNTCFCHEKISNVEVLVGDFKDQLSPAMAKLHGRKLIFIDGNHDGIATRSYFETILAGVQNDDIIVFDDIRWSREMKSAWQEIIKNEQVACSIDLFFVGIVLFRKEFKEKQHFVIRF